MADISVIAKNLKIATSVALSPGVRLANTDEEVQHLEEEVEIIEERLDNLVSFGTHYDFPSCGEKGRLYVATDEEEAIYVWDGDKYVALTGINALQKQVSVLDGGGSLDGE